MLNFIYTRCPDICPLQTERMALIQRMVKPTARRDQIRLVSVTADPVNDTPDVMKSYREQHGMDTANWLFLTSGPNRPDETRQLATRYRNRYQLEPDGSITHGTVFHVVDGDGRWRGDFHWSFDWKPEHLVDLLTELENHDRDAALQPVRSIWQRIKQLF